MSVELAYIAIGDIHGELLYEGTWLVAPTRAPWVHLDFIRPCAVHNPDHGHGLVRCQGCGEQKLFCRAEVRSLFLESIVPEIDAFAEAHRACAQ